MITDKQVEELVEMSGVKGQTYATQYFAELVYKQAIADVLALARDSRVTTGAVKGLIEETPCKT